jgi:endonuclease G
MITNIRIKFLFLFLFPLSVFSQSILKDSVHVKTEIFTVVYSEVLQQPKWVTYTVQCPTGTAPRKGMDFYIVQGITTSDNADYANNVYDKGHCAPAADFNCTKEMLYKTFSYVNCTLQHERLNRGVWRLLEAYERNLALTNTVTVEIRMVYSKN